MDAHFEVEELPGWDGDNDSWCYLNFLKVPGGVLLPCLSENFDSKEDFNAFVKMIRKRSGFKTKDTVEYGDKILTLSTCAGGGNRRMVVHAVLIKDGE